MLFQRLMASFSSDLRSSAVAPALVRFCRSLRTLRHPRLSRRTLAIVEARRAELQLDDGDTFFHLQQRHYLAQRLSTRQRIESVWHHYDHEARHYLPSFRRQVYGESGLLLWQERVDEVDFSIRLLPGNDNRMEGELSVVLYVDGARLSVMSFSYVDARIFGLPSAPIIFITRNQSGREELQQGQFRAAFKHTTPPYFCLAAVIGIAASNGMGHVAAVHHDSHIACDHDNRASLENTYSGFWRAFHATPLDRKSWLLPVPMATVPLSEIKAKHRKRALVRREAWRQVAASASTATREHQAEAPQVVPQWSRKSELNLVALANA
jgi:uncharacterized protein VirK/YbjX